MGPVLSAWMGLRTRTYISYCTLTTRWNEYFEYRVQSTDYVSTVRRNCPSEYRPSPVSESMDLGFLEFSRIR